MSAGNSPGPAGSKGPSTLMKVGLAAVFLLVLVGASVWVIRTFVSQSSDTVVIPEVAATGAAPATPGAPLQVDIGAPLIGGQVNNDQGAGIPNVRVRLVWLLPADPAGGARQNATRDVHTDASGHWSYQGVPKDALSRLNIMLTQNDYVTLTERAPDADKLLSQSLVQVMVRGLVLRGIVVDGDGQPVAGVKITAGRPGARNAPTATSNADGAFTMRHIPPGPSVSLVAVSTDYAPSSTIVKLPAGKDPVRLVMTAGRTITGRVLDKSGNPQEGVTVSINRFEQTFLAGTLKATTDSQGNFSLAHAPLGAVQMVTNKQGYTSDFEQVGADTNSFNFTIAPLLAMHGTVTDAVTGDPIPQFQVIVGAKWVNSNSPNFSMTGGSFTGGQYLQTLDGYSGNIDSWYVKIVARGYMPAVSPPLYASGAQDFKLQPAKDLIGRVLDAAGNPVVGAQVMVGGPGQQMQIQNGDLMNVGNGQTAQVTDGQGKYDVPPQIGNYMIVAVSPAGYGTADQDDLARSPDIHFTAWGRIEGTVIVDGKPGAGEQIDAYEADRTYDPQSPMLYFGMNAQSDAQGHFTFNQVPATDIIVSRLVQPDGGRTNNLTTAQSEQITVTAGQTTTVTLGGKGRPVIGQVKFPAEAATWPEHQINSNVMMKVDLPPLPIPPDMARTPQDYQTWMSKFRKTDAGKAYFRLLAKRRVYQLELDADGNFKIEDVVPGTYTVNISVFPRQGGQILAQAVTEFTVPPIPGGYTSEPLEIPTLVLKGNHPISVGDPAPGFSAATLDGKQINLFDYHGKYVLLEIWMSMFPNGTTQTQQLKAVHDAYGKDDRLVMIGLSADMLPARTADFVRKNQLDWIQCVLGPQQAQMIAMNYGVQEIPYILLIGPDGNLLAMHLKDDAIMAAVRQALGPPATQP